MEIEVSEGGEGDEFQGLFVTDLKGLKRPIGMQEAARRAKEKLKGEMRSLLEEVAGEIGEDLHYYDEWDCQIGDYRVRWCRLREKEVETGSSGFVDQTLDSYSDLVEEVRRQFQMLKPERFKRFPTWSGVKRSTSTRRSKPRSTGGPANPPRRRYTSKRTGRTGISPLSFFWI